MRESYLEAYDKNAGNPPIYELPAAERPKMGGNNCAFIDKWAAELEGQGVPR